MSDRTITFRLNAVTRGFTQNMAQAGRSVDQFATRNEKALRRAGMAFTAMGVAGLAGLRSISDEAVEFDSTMTKLSTQIGLTAREIDDMRDAALSLQGTGRGAQELGEAAFFISSAGLRGAEALDVMESSAKASAIGLGETAEIADLTTSAINAYGAENLSAAAASDTLLAAVREGKAEASELAGAMGQVLPIASEMGVTFDQVGAATAAMTRTGTDASTAAMQLRQILMGLLNPTEQARDMLDEYGMSAEAMRETIREDGLFAALEMLRDAFGDNEEAMSTVFENARSLSGVLDLVGENADSNREIFDNLTDTTGQLSEAHAEWAETAEGMQERASAAWENARISFGESTLGMRVAMAETSAAIADDFNNMSDGAQRFVTLGGGAAAAMSTIGGAAMMAVPMINRHRVSVAQLGSSALTTRGALLGMGRFMVGPWGLAIGAATVATGLFLNQKRKAAEAVLEFEAALRSDEGALGSHTEALIRERLAQDGLVEAADTLGITYGELFEAVSGGERSFQDLVDRIRDQGQAMAESGEWTAEHIDATNTLVGGLGDLSEALVSASRESRVADLEARGLGDALDGMNPQLRDAVLGARTLEDALELLPRHLRPSADAMGDLGDMSQGTKDELAELGIDVDGLADSFGGFAPAVSAAASSLQAGMDPLDEYRSRMQKLAEENETSLDKMGEDFDAYMASLDQTLQDQREWHDNLNRIREAAGDEYADMLAAQGPEYASLHAEIADQEADEIREAGETALEIRDEANAEALARLLRSGEVMVEETGEFSSEMVAAMAEELGVAPEVVEGILDGTNATVESGLAQMAVIGGDGAEEVVRNIVEKLGLGAADVTRIVNAYGRALSDGLNPIVKSVGGRAIVFTEQTLSTPGWTAFRADGGFGTLPDQATIQAPTAGLVQWAEPETHGEAFIPLAASKRARSLAIWEETGRRLGADISRLDPHSLHEVGMADGGIRSFADGGFSSLDDVPDVPGLPFSGEIADVGQATMEHAREAAMSWLEKNLAPKLGAGIGWQAMWEALSTQFPSAALHSAYRPGAITATGNPSYHGMGRAIDVSPRGDIAQWIRDNYMAETREMIFSPFNHRQIHNGRNHMYTGITRAMHWDHVHWAMANGGIRSFDDGGMLPTGLSLAHNGTGSPETVMSNDQIGDIVKAIEDVDAQLQEMAEQEEADRRAARLEGLEGDEREQFLAEERRDARRAELEAERAELEGILSVEREIAANREQWEFDRLDPRQQLAVIYERLEAERRFSDEWMRLARERDQIVEEMHREGQARADELRKRAEDTFSELVQLLEERDRIEQRMADRRIRYERDVAEARSRHAEQVEREIRAREDSLRFDPLSRMTFQFGNRPAAIAANVRDQIAAVLDSERLLEDLRSRGLDDSVISALGLDDPAQLRTLEEFARATDEEIAGLNDAIVDRNRVAGERAERDAGRAYTTLGSTLVEMRGELDRELADLHEDFRVDMAEMNVELQEIGQDQGRSFAEAIAEGINSGIPAIRQAAQAARQAAAAAADTTFVQRGTGHTWTRAAGVGRWEYVGRTTDDGLERAHTGGLIAGRGEVPIIAKGGERIVTDRQNRQLMDAIERLAGARSGGPLVTVGQQVFEDPVDVEHFGRQIAQLATRVGR